MLLFALIFIYILIVFLEVPQLVKQKLYKELVIYSVFFLLGVYMSLAQFYDWPMLNPFKTLFVLLADK